MHAGRPSPSTSNPDKLFEGTCGSGVRGSVVLGGGEVGQVIRLSDDIDSIVASKFKQVLSDGPSQAVERHAPLLCVMDEISFGSFWDMNSP